MVPEGNPLCGIFQLLHPGNVGFFMGMFSSNKSGGIVGDILGEAIGMAAMGLWGS